MNYFDKPGDVGGFNRPLATAGYYNFSQNLSWYQGRSTIASIPEYMRNPGLLIQDLMVNIQEGRSNMMRLLYEEAQRGGIIYAPDVKFRYRVNVKPHDRIYLAQGSYTVSNMVTEFKLSDYTRPNQSYPTSSGNPRVVGDIARLQEGDFILLMFSWCDKNRVLQPRVGEAYDKPVPEIAKVISVDLANNSFKALRNWAGSQRQTAPVAPPTLTVVANSATPTTNQIRQKDAFFMLLPNSVPEDEIDQKVMNYTVTFEEGIMQRVVRAWGGRRMSEIINRNLGNPSPVVQSKQIAIEQFFKQWELAALWGEKNEGFDENYEWYGFTDGLLTGLPKEHYVGLVPINYSLLRTRPEKAFGSFDFPIFNKILEDKGYIGSQRKILLCGANFHTNVTTMFNYMTQNIPNIVSEWKVVGNRFQSSNGLTVDIVPSDTMSLNGMTNKGILYDPETFKIVQLQNYPTDIVEIANENPLKSNGFIHGVQAFVNLNPDSTWVFTIDEALKDATLASYNNYKLGVVHP